MDYTVVLLPEITLLAYVRGEALPRRGELLTFAPDSLEALFPGREAPTISVPTGFEDILRPRPRDTPPPALDESTHTPTYVVLYVRHVLDGPAAQQQSLPIKLHRLATVEVRRVPDDRREATTLLALINNLPPSPADAP